MLGIAANLVVFGLLNAVLLHPLDVSDQQSLYQVTHKQWMIGRPLTTSYPAFEDFRRRNTTFSGMAAIDGYCHGTLRWRNGLRNVSAMKSPAIISICLEHSRKPGDSFTRATSMARIQRYVVLAMGCGEARFKPTGP